MFSWWRKLEVSSSLNFERKQNKSKAKQNKAKQNKEEAEGGLKSDWCRIERRKREGRGRGRGRGRSGGPSIAGGGRRDGGGDNLGEQGGRNDRHSAVDGNGRAGEKDRKATQEYSSDLRVNYKEVLRMAMKERDAERKVNFFRRALDIGYFDGSVYNAYGKHLSSSGRRDDAIKMFKCGLELCTRDRQSLYHGYGTCLIKAGRIADAKDALKRGIEEGEQTARNRDVVEGREGGGAKVAFLRHTLGMLYLSGNDAVSARKIFTGGSVDVGPRCMSRLKLGEALCEARLGDEDRARELFEVSLSLDDRHAHAWQAWSVMEIKSTNYAAARGLLAEGIEKCPNHGALWQALAQLERRGGDLERSREVIRSGLSNCRRHIPLYIDWSKLEMLEGSEAAAMDVVEAAMKIDKSSAALWCQALKIERKVGTAESSRDLLDRALKVTKGRGGKARSVLLKEGGDFYAHLGRFDRARDLFEEGLRLDPLSAGIYHSYAELEASVFNLQGLSALNRRAEEVFSNNAEMPPKFQPSFYEKGDECDADGNAAAGGGGDGKARKDSLNDAVDFPNADMVEGSGTIGELLNLDLEVEP